MTRTAPLLRNSVFALVIAGALGFGAAQAFAAPAEAPATHCSGTCTRECGTLGGVYKYGRCLCCG